MRNLLLIFSFILIGLESFANVTITTNPVSDQILPDRDLVETQISMPANSNYEIVIRTPKSNPFVGTDFPIVEDTQLYHFKGFTKSGQVNFKTIYPIRGVYDIKVLLNGEWQHLVLEINEVPSEINNMLIFLGAILAVGILGGFFLQKTTLTTTAALALLLILSMTPDLQAHSESHEVEKKGEVLWQETRDGYHFSVLFDSNQAVVGQSVQFYIQLVEENQITQKPFTVNIQSFHMEDQTVMFDGTFTSSEATARSCGLCSLNESLHFFDGAETKITFRTILPNGATMELDGVIDVVSVSPPISAIVKSLILIGMLVIVGLGIGFFLIPVKKQALKHAV